MTLLAVFIVLAIFAALPLLVYIMQWVDDGGATTTKTTTPKIETHEEEEVVVEEMILHDMNNNDDTFDIGAIDFND